MCKAGSLPRRATLSMCSGLQDFRWQLQNTGSSQSDFRERSASYRHTSLAHQQRIHLHLTCATRFSWLQLRAGQASRQTQGRSNTVPVRHLFVQHLESCLSNSSLRAATFRGSHCACGSAGRRAMCDVANVPHIGGRPQPAPGTIRSTLQRLAAAAACVGAAQPRVSWHWT
jgi:hypothetical protein